MIANSSGDSRPNLNLRHSLTENQTTQLVAQLLCLIGIGGGAKTFGKFKERLLFLFPRFDTQFNEFHQDSVIAKALTLGQTVDLFGNGSGKRDTASDMLGCWHGIIIHQFGAFGGLS